MSWYEGSPGRVADADARLGPRSGATVPSLLAGGRAALVTVACAG